MIGIALGDALAEAFSYLLYSGFIFLAYAASKHWCLHSLRRSTPKWRLIPTALLAIAVVSAAIAYGGDVEIEDLVGDRFIGERAAVAAEKVEAGQLQPDAMASFQEQYRLRVFLRTAFVLLIAFVFALSNVRPVAKSAAADSARPSSTEPM